MVVGNGTIECKHLEEANSQCHLVGFQFRPIELDTDAGIIGCNCSMTLHNQGPFCVLIDRKTMDFDPTGIRLMLTKLT